MSNAVSRIVIVMGVAASGKTVTGSAIARSLRVSFLDADDFHPKANKEKMRAGTPLNDDDRWPWLGSFARALREVALRDGLVVGACSALRRAYRDHLVQAAGEAVLFVFLDGPRELLARRIASRVHEYMPAALLDSQLATLEPPTAEENAITVPVSIDIVEAVDRAVAAISRPRAPS